VAAAAGACFAYRPDALAAEYTMKIGTATRSGDKNVWMERFKERVEKRTNGRVEIQLYPSSQLGSNPRQIEGVQMGAIEAWVGPPSFAKGLDPRLEVIDAPGEWRDAKHAFESITDSEFRDTYLAVAESKGLKGISIWTSSVARIVTRNQPIRTLEDFKGQKIRVLASAMEMETLKKVGAAPVPMPPSDVLPALQQGVIDGVQSALVIFVPFQYWTAAKYLTETDVAYINSAAFVSKVWWDRLPADMRAAMAEEGKKLEAEMFSWALDDNKRMREAWLKNGGVIVDFPASEREKFMKIAKTVGPSVVSNQPAMRKMYELMEKVSARH
jgi:tripartite ATP-independent transporter DctP family solute receptor